MACGLPVITSVFAGVSGLLRHGTDGFVLEETTDAGTLAGLIRTLAADPQKRRQVGESAAETARQWSWDQSAVAAWALIQEVVERKEAARGRP